MKEDIRLKILNEFVSDDEIQKLIKLKKLEQYKESYNNGSALLQSKLEDGWEIDAVLKSKTKISKDKPIDILFKDKVWTLFAQLGFRLMNKSDCYFPYDKKDDSLVHKIDVFAKDDETVLIIKCISSKRNSIYHLDTEIEEIKSNKAGIINSLHALFPHSKPKFKYIIATQNIGISAEDDLALSKVDGIHFSEDTIDYYYALQSQLGSAARYQLLGALFAGQEIPDLENRIPAIEGKMGGHTYYSFSIEPEKLLKIGYVLHRNKANENMMPTYQRLIKKSSKRNPQFC